MTESVALPGLKKVVSSNVILQAKSPQHNNEPLQLSDRPKTNQKTSELVSLLNFDPTARARHFLNSPRSIQAVKNLGFEEYELLIRDKRKIMKEDLPEELEHDREYYIELRLEHYELRRLEKLKMCIEERSRVIQANKVSVSQSRGASRNADSYRKKLEFITSGNFSAQQHENGVVRKEYVQEEEIKNKHSMINEGKIHREQKRFARDMRMEEMHKELLEQQEANQLRRKEQRERLINERENEAKRRDEERKSKIELLDEKLKEIENRKLEEANYRRKLMDEKTSKMKTLKDELKFRRHFESELARQQYEEKRQLMKENYDRILLEQHQVIREFELRLPYRLIYMQKRFQEHQREIEQKRERNEEHKRQELNFRKNKSKQHFQEIKEKLDVCYQEQQRKKNYFLYKLDLADKNKKRLEEELESRKKMNITKTHEKEKMLRTTLKEKERAEKEMKSAFIAFKNDEIRKANQKKTENLREIQRKYFLEMLHAQDAEENRRRLEKLQELKKQEIRERILLESGQQRKESPGWEKQSHKRKISPKTLELGKEQLGIERSNIGSRKSQHLPNSKFEILPEHKLNKTPRQLISSSQSIRPSTQNSAIRRTPLEISTGPVGRLFIIKMNRTPSVLSNKPIELISPFLSTPKVITGKNLRLSAARVLLVANPSEYVAEELPKKEEIPNKKKEEKNLPKEPEEKVQVKTPIEKTLFEEPKINAVSNRADDVTSNQTDELINKLYIAEMKETLARNLPEILLSIVEEEKKYNENPGPESLQDSALAILKISKEQGAEYEKIKYKHNAYLFFEEPK